MNPPPEHRIIEWVEACQAQQVIRRAAEWAERDIYLQLVQTESPAVVQQVAHRLGLRTRRIQQLAQQAQDHPPNERSPEYELITHLRRRRTP